MTPRFLNLKNFKLNSSSKSLVAFIKREQQGLATGLSDFDSKLLGLQGLVGIIGEPKAGKSTLALQIALHTARVGFPVLFVDIENGRQLVIERALCQLLGYSSSKLKMLSDDHLLSKLKKLDELPIYFYEGPISLEQMDNTILQLRELYSDKYVLLVIDSLQKLPQSFDDFRLSIDKWLIEFDRLKLKYKRNLIVLLVSEKSRENYGRASISAGKESGRIEYTLEQQLDLRIDRQNKDLIILECTLNRHGEKDFSTSLTRVFADESAGSFTFRLSEIGSN